MLVGGSTADMSKLKLTVIADGILTRITEKQKRCQLVLGTGFDVADFVNDVANGRITIKTDVVCLLVGNDQWRPGTNTNMAKQIEKLITQVWIKRPTARIYVSSLMPRPTQETVSEALLIKMNGGIAAMCRKLTKFGKNTVKYMPLHQSCLEKWKHYDPKSKKMQISTRIVQPHGKFFEIGTDILNKAGATVLFQRMKEIVIRDLMPLESEAQPLKDRPGLVMVIENDQCSTSSEGKKRSLSHEEEVVEPSTSEVGNKRMKERLDTEMGPPVGVKKPNNLKKVVPGMVAHMVDRWEQLSQGTLADDIDLELGQENVVPVDLGDQVEPQGEVMKLVMDM